MHSEEKTLEVKDLKKYFPIRQSFLQSLSTKGNKEWLKAVDGVSFNIWGGETLGLAGESGSGKTTTGRLIAHLLEPSGGIIEFEGKECTQLKRRELKQFHRKVQMIFQDPYASQNPRFTVDNWTEEPLIIHRLGNSGWRKEKVVEALEKVGLRPAIQYLHQFPHELSGGQRQRLAVARALILEPKCLIADEPTSMLDVSVRAGLMKLIKSLTQEYGLATLYISHDLSVMRYICERIAIMYLGKIVEIGPTEKILKGALHPYSQALISSVPIPNPHFKRVRARIPNAIFAPTVPNQGCHFHPRCPFSSKRCNQEVPQVLEVESGWSVSCWKVSTNS